MVTRHSFLGKVLGGLILAAFILYVLPHIKPTLVSLFVVAISVGIIGDTLARYFAGKNSWQILIPAALIVLADVLFFVYVPASPL